MLPGISPVFIAGVVFFSMQSCKESYRVVHENTRENGGAVRLGKFRRESMTVQGIRQWVVTAEEGYIFGLDKESRIVTYNFHFSSFDSEGKLSGEIDAKRGEIDYEKRTIRVDGDVNYKDAGGKLIKTTELTYDMDSKIVESVKPVVIFDEGTTTNCKRGIWIDNENEKQICRSPDAVNVDTGKKKQGESSSTVEDIFQ